MKKVIITLVLTVVYVLAFAGIAFAANFPAPFTKTHYGFSASTEGCAGCHVTHTATAAKLLRTGNTQTGFCYMCHGPNSAGSPYDVEQGLITGFDAVNRPSPAGAFDFLPTTTSYTGMGIMTRTTLQTTNQSITGTVSGYG